VRDKTGRIEAIVLALFAASAIVAEAFYAVHAVKGCNCLVSSPAMRYGIIDG